MFCSKCGAELPEGNMKCPACDAAENAGPLNESVETPATAPKKKSKLGIIIATVVLIAAGVAAFLFLGKEEVDPAVGNWSVVELSVGTDGDPLRVKDLPVEVRSDGTMSITLSEELVFNLFWEEESPRREDGSIYYDLSSDGPMTGGMLWDKNEDTLTIGTTSSADSELMFWVCERDN